MSDDGGGLDDLDDENYEEGDYEDPDGDKGALGGRQTRSVLRPMDELVLRRVDANCQRGACRDVASRVTMSMRVLEVRL